MTIGPVRQVRWLGWPLLVLAAAAAGFLLSLAIGHFARRLEAPVLSPSERTARSPFPTPPEPAARLAPRQ
jgi:hypothetical protein